MEQELFYDEQDYEREHMDYHAAVDDDDEEMEADDPENN